jgi:acrylyl-CoA reductase (NADPH)
MTKTYKALESKKTEQHNHLAIVEKEIQDLPEGDLLIKVEYSSLNYKDAMSAKGIPGVTRNYPHTPGIDAAGVVESSKSANFKEGDKVIVTGYDLGMNTSGGFGQYVSVPSDWAINLPEGLTTREAMCLGTAGLTAGLSVHALEKHRDYIGLSGTKSIVTGATGGVGSIAVMLLSKLGSEVTAVTGKSDQSEFLTSIGANSVISRDELAEIARKPIGKSVWDLGVDVVSGDILTLLLTSLNPGGAVACSGLVGGPSFESSIFPFILRGNALLGIDSVEIPLDAKNHIWKHFATDWKINLENSIKEIGLEELPEEIETILKGGQVGRILVQL